MHSNDTRYDFQNRFSDCLEKTGGKYRVFEKRNVLRTGGHCFGTVISFTINDLCFVDCFLEKVVSYEAVFICRNYSVGNCAAMTRLIRRTTSCLLTESIFKAAIHWGIHTDYVSFVNKLET